MKQIEKFLDYMDRLEERKVLLSIFGISLIARLLYVILFPTVVWGDAVAYENLATGLVEGKGFGGGTSYDLPGYPLFLAIVYSIFGHTHLIVHMLQAFIGALTCIVIYYIGKSVLNKKIGILSASIAALYPTFIIYSGMLYTETLFIFLLCLSVLYLIKIHEQPSIKNLLIAGVSLGLGILIRPGILLFIPVILIWMLISSKEKKKNFMRFMAIFLIVVVVVSPWTIRNYNVHHEFVPIGTGGGVTLWYGYNPDAMQYLATDVESSHFNQIWEIPDEIERNKWGYEKSLDFIKQNPIQSLILDIMKLTRFWGLLLPFFNCYLSGFFIMPIPKWLFMTLAPLTILPFMIILPLAILGILFYQNWDKKAFLLFLLILYYPFIHSITWGLPRFQLQIMPFLIIFAAYAVCSKNRIKSEIKLGGLKTKMKLILSVMLIALLIACWCYTLLCYSDQINILIGKLF